MKNLSEFVKINREKMGISQRELARKIGVDNSYIAKIENGSVTKPSIEVILHLSTFFNEFFDKVLDLSGYTKLEIYELTRMGNLVHFSRMTDLILGSRNLKDYTVENELGVWLDIAKILEHYKNNDLSLEETVRLLDMCCPFNEEEYINIYFTEQHGDICIEYDPKDLDL